MLQKAEFNINNKQYHLITDYKDNPDFRYSLNRLTHDIYGFDFEEWFQNGYWQDKYIPYSLFYENEVVANVSVNTMEFLIQGNRVKPIQLGTVMTEKYHRNQGLIRILINSVLEDYEKNSDFIYLFANDSVLDFYPRFGFIKTPEYGCSKYFHRDKAAYDCRKLHMDYEPDRAILVRLIQNAYPNAKVAMINNTELLMFYCGFFMKEFVYYIEALDTAVIAEYNGNQLVIQDVFCEKPVDLDCVINAVMRIDTMEVHLGFTPSEDTSYTKEILTKADTTLFIKGKNLLGNARFPVLSHA